ncbi:putative importin 9 [Aureobasidium pullulans]|uniref:Importin 9 n=1 Tax=Aureobasidium pullulans TaxID=5580 RepID=A0AB74IW45_AURPU|nr:putative importin 9 [Aureobasidium pullulans]
MERQIVQLLQDTQSSHEGPRTNAELQLRQLYTNTSFAPTLVAVSTHQSIPLATRQAALLLLKQFVQQVWSPQFEEFKGEMLVSAEDRATLRQALLDLATDAHQERKIKSAASIVVSKIATADFPDEYPNLLPTLLRIINNGQDGQLHGALKVLQDLIDDCFNDDQFFNVAHQIVSSVFAVAASSRPTILRALAVSVFRSCFDMLEMVLEDHKTAVKAFAEDTLATWYPFFLDTLNMPVPNVPVEQEESQNPVAENYRGIIALKLQVVKVLMRVRQIFPSALAPQAPALFAATWQELNNLRQSYHESFILHDRQGRLEDADGLPFTLDFLVLEEIDFMQACLRAAPVRKQLEEQLRSQSMPDTWVTEVMKLAVTYSHITTEEEGLWDIDFNIFVAEESNVTANYTPRTACADLVIKLGEWQSAATIEGLLHHTRELYSTDSSWKSKEAALFILNQLLTDFFEADRPMVPEVAAAYIDFVRYAMQQEHVFLRARGHLTASSLVRAAGDAVGGIATSLMEQSLHAITNDPSDVVKVSCIRSMQAYLAGVSTDNARSMQAAVIAAIHTFVTELDFGELDESEDIMIAIVETLRDVIMIDTRICLTGSGLDVLFTIASWCSFNYQIYILITETFEDLTETLSDSGPDVYTQLCAKVLPSLSGAFDVANLTDENSLTNLAADMLTALAEHGPSPLPQGFIVTIMPKLTRLLLESPDEELLKSATSATRYMLEKDPEQMFNWANHDGKSGLEVVLVIIDRLLGPTVEDNAAGEVGGLAAALVEKAGSERLGPYLAQLLSAVAHRLSAATQTQVIQNLILVFARLSLLSAREVIDFLAQLAINGESGLQVVLTKWLENSVNFAGYDEIRQNIIALSRLYDLHDPRLDTIQVKGDMIMPTSTRIMTRSRARANPDQYNIIPAPLKIVKILVDELLSPLTNAISRGVENLAPASEVEKAESVASDESGWEDEDGFLDLGAGMTKEALMGYAAEDAPNRGRDDETQAYLLQWFGGKAQEDGFGEVFAQLTPEEQEKLRSMGSQQA